VIAEVLLGVLLVMVGVGGTAVVLTRDPTRQALVLSSYGLLLGIVMVALQAPDVALAQIGVGTAIVPLLVVLTVAKVQREVSAHQADRDGQGGADADQGRES
jgi:uncharacterized MnhB-related membrane protein